MVDDFTTGRGVAVILIGALGVRSFSSSFEEEEEEDDDDNDDDDVGVEVTFVEISFVGERAPDTEGDGEEDEEDC